jgi:glutathionylspermidine synthase
MAEFVKKPLLSREGSNITLRTLTGEVSTAGPYPAPGGTQNHVYQALAPAATFDGMYPVLGSWYVTDQGAAGIGIRESDGPITGNLSRFVPHYFDYAGRSHAKTKTRKHWNRSPHHHAGRQRLWLDCR